MQKIICYCKTLTVLFNTAFLAIFIKCAAWKKIVNVILCCQAIAMLTIILSAIVGNTLVIVSVFRYERLRIIANSFIVSMAMADLLVACLVMPFKASIDISGNWQLGKVYLLSYVYNNRFNNS